VLRAASRWLLLLSVVRAKASAFQVINAFMRDISEWTRVRVAIKTFNAAVRLLQNRCREFVAFKRRRVEIMEKIWQTAEDRLLSGFFKKHAQNVMKAFKDDIEKEIETASAREQVNLRKQLNEMNYSFDWRNYRIPPVERRRAISRYYMNTLRKRVQNEVLNSMRLKALMGTQREIMHYLAEFQPSARTDFKPYLRSVLEGLDEIGQEESANVLLSDWWVLGEDVAIDLIAVTARDLIQVDPFQGHPANKDLPGNVLYAKATSFARTGSITYAATRSRRATIHGNEDDTKADAQSTQPGMDRPPAIGRDLEDIFNGFTPQLGAFGDEHTVANTRNVAGDQSLA